MYALSQEKTGRGNLAKKLKPNSERSQQDHNEAFRVNRWETGPAGSHLEVARPVNLILRECIVFPPLRSRFNTSMLLVEGGLPGT